MVGIVILNVVLAVLIVAAILSLLGWGIFTDRAEGAAAAQRQPRARRAQRSGKRTARGDAGLGVAAR